MELIRRYASIQKIDFAPETGLIMPSEGPIREAWISAMYEAIHNCNITVTDVNLGSGISIEIDLYYARGGPPILVCATIGVNDDFARHQTIDILQRICNPRELIPDKKVSITCHCPIGQLLVVNRTIQHICFSLAVGNSDELLWLDGWLGMPSSASIKYITAYFVEFASDERRRNFLAICDKYDITPRLLIGSDLRC